MTEDQNIPTVLTPDSGKPVDIGPVEIAKSPTSGKMSRREFLRLGALAAAGTVIAACGPAATVVPPATREPGGDQPPVPTPTSEPAPLEAPADKPENQPPATLTPDQINIQEELEQLPFFDRLRAEAVTAFLNDHPEKIAEFTGEDVEDPQTVIKYCFWSAKYTEGFTLRFLEDIAFGKDGLLLSSLLEKKWGEANGVETSPLLYWVKAEDMCLLSLLTRHLLATTDLKARLRGVATCKVGEGIEYYPDEDYAGGQGKYPDLTDHGWNSLKRNYLTQLNLALPFTILVLETNPGTSLTLTVERGEGLIDPGPFNAHMGMAALFKALGMEMDDFRKGGYIADTIPSEYQGIIVPTSQIQADKEVPDIECTLGRIVYMLMPLIWTLRCYGDFNAAQMQELSLFRDGDFYQPRLDVIDQYNTKPIWDTRFRKIYEAITEFGHNT